MHGTPSTPAHMPPMHPGGGCGNGGGGQYSPEAQVGASSAQKHVAQLQPVLSRSAASHLTQERIA